MMGDGNESLSVRGQQRCDEILVIVLEESRRLQRRRKQRRALAGTMALGVLLASVVWTFWIAAEPDSDLLRVTIANSGDSSASPSALDLDRHIIRTEVDDLARYLVRTQEKIPVGVPVDDTELLTTLADLGHTEGIVRIGGKTWITSQLTSQLEFKN